MASRVERLAAEIEALTQKVRALETAPQLGHSSLEDAAINAYDQDGQQSLIIGRQYDGSFIANPVSGPTPPQPSAPTLEPVPGGLRVAWAGEFFMGAMLPIDYSRVEVHLSSTPDFDPTFASTLRGTIESPRGGDVLVLSLTPGTTYYAKLVCRSQAGKGSAPSPEVSGAPRAVEIADLSFDPADYAGTTVHYGPAIDPATAVNGDLWLQTPDNVAHRLVDGAWQPVRDQGIVSALEQVVLAQEAADQAAADALVAHAVANTKGTVYHQPTAPADDPNGLWFDTANGNRPRVLTGRKALLLRYGGGGHATAVNWTDQGWDVTAPAVDTVPTLAELLPYDLVVLDGGYMSVSAPALARAAEAFAAGVSILTTGNDTTAVAPMHTGIGQRGTDNALVNTPNPTGPITGWADFADSDNRYYLTGLGAGVQVVGTTLVAGVAQPVITALEDPQTTARWLHVQPYYPTWRVAAHAQFSAWLASRWTHAQDADIAAAAADALAAHNAATAAQADADAAQSAATLAQSTADTKVAVYRQASAPTGGTYRVNDLWLDGTNKVHAWTGTAWAVADDQRIGTALSTAQGKTTLFAQISAPSTTGRTVGDVWLDTDDGNRRYIWTGSWTPSPVGVAGLDVQVGGGNIVEHSSFETDANNDGMADGWYAWKRGAADSATNPRTHTVSRVSGLIPFGQWAQRVQIASLGADLDNQSAVSSDAAKPFRVMGGTKYVLSAYGRTNRGQGTVSLRFTTANGTYVSDAFLPGFFGTAIERKHGIVNVPATAELCSVTFQIGNLVGDWMEIDGVQVEMGDFLTGYSPKPDEILPGQVTAPMISATARQLGATVVFYQITQPASGMIAGDFWLDTDDPQRVLRTYNGSTWEIVQNAAITAALTAGTNAQGTANSKVLIFTQPSAPVSGTPAIPEGSLWVDTDDGNRMWTWTSGAWVDRRLGNGAIQPGSLVASDVIATGTVSAALLEAIMVLTSEVVAGDPTGTHARMTPNGFKVFGVNPDTSLPYEVARMGSDTDDYFAVTDTTGRLKATIDSLGRVSAEELFAQKLYVAGTDVSAQIDDMPRGFVAGAARGQIAGVDYGSTSEFGLFEMTVEFEPNRLYALRSSNLWIRSAATARGDVNVRARATNVRGSAPPAVSITSPVFVRQIHASVPTTGVPVVFSRMFRFTSYQHARFLVSIAGFGTKIYWGVSTTANNVIDTMGTVEYDPIMFWIEDLGKQPWTNRWVFNNGGGSTGTTTPPPTTEPAPVVRRTNSYLAEWTRTFTGGGAVKDGAVTGVEALQGQSPSYPSGGNYKSLIGFPSQMIADVANSTIEKVEVYLYANHWHNNSGGTVVMGTHNHVFAPSGWSGSTSPGAPAWTDRVRFPGWPKPGGMWVDVSWMAAGLLDGSIRGLVLGPAPDTNSVYYGRINGAGMPNPPTFRITYTK